MPFSTNQLSFDSPFLESFVDKRIHQPVMNLRFSILRWRTN